ncbi:hypothetical protein [Burkholderia sp. Ax-1719]|uniref:hypothetical protein n=1 Tax=Burkholderia sp. Ax-1719 TaxID=2608334 RepID=UPI001422ED36|nr:hypothetical protein [Burkholderia sp. Ax-1719]NIE63063.1 hypothetical protein [Burkholderia sp. Ax-1719]
MVYQRNREIKVLSAELPETPIEEIESLVSAWKLVIWVGSDDAKDRQEQSDVDTSAPSPAGRGLSSSAASFWSHVTVPVLTDEEDLRLRRLVRSRAQEIFMPPAIAFAEQKAEALSSIAQGVSVAFACELISRIYGFTDWQNMVSQFVPASRSKFDEEVALDLQLSRRTWQISVIEQAFEVEKWLATDLHSLWLPSSHKMSYESTAKWTRDSTVSSSAPSRVVRKSGTLRLGKHGTDPSQDDGVRR